MNIKVGIIVQARLCSSRLPSKVLSCPQNLSMSLLEIGFSRLSRSKYSDSVVYAIPDNEPDLADYLSKKNIVFFKGHPTDVMNRYLTCASAYGFDIIVRITADCPLVDPLLIDQFVDEFIATSHPFSSESYLSNYTPPETSTFCNGSDIEIFRVSSLEKFFTLNPSSLYREHVTFQFWDGTYSVAHIHKHYHGGADLSRMRITVDYQDDLDMLAILSDNVDIINSSFDDIIFAYFSQELYLVNGRHGSRDGWV